MDSEMGGDSLGGSNRASYGIIWIHLESFLTHLDSFGLRVQLDSPWIHSFSLGPNWDHMGTLELNCIHLGSFGLMNSHGLNRPHLDRSL